MKYTSKPYFCLISIGNISPNFSWKQSPKLKNWVFTSLVVLEFCFILNSPSSWSKFGEGKHCEIKWYMMFYVMAFLFKSTVKEVGVCFGIISISTLTSTNAYKNAIGNDITWVSHACSWSYLHSQSQLCHSPTGIPNKKKKKKKCSFSEHWKHEQLHNWVQLAVSYWHRYFHVL